jgi:hypothetical protein
MVAVRGYVRSNAHSNIGELMHVIEKILFLIFTVTLASGVLAANGPGGGGQGNSNSNAQSLPDSNRGLDRAQERKSEQGLEHSKAAPKKKANKATLKEPDAVTSPEPPKLRVP